MHTLITIPASHYVEKARWALDLAGVPYQESKWPPIVHYLRTFPVGAHSVPVLRTPTGDFIRESSDICQYAHKFATSKSGCHGPWSIYPNDPKQLEEVLRLEKFFSQKLGVFTRVVCYNSLFANKAVAMDTLCRAQDMERWKQSMFCLMYPVCKGVICSGLGVTPVSAAQCLTRVRQIFKEVGDLLEDGREYLVGDTLTAADISFAAMASILLLPEEYGANLPKMEQFPIDFPGYELRNTSAGKFALRISTVYRDWYSYGAEASM